MTVLPRRRRAGSTSPSLALAAVLALMLRAGVASGQSVAPPDSGAARDTSVHTRFGAFVDSYYAYDLDRPPRIDRAFTTQAARHNEFNVNLAYVEAVVTGPRVHGRLALQAGTSVQANYAGEYRVGQVSGPSLAQHIQEAYAGVRIGRAVWVDAGIFLSHIGVESFISRDNPTYTRSLAAEFTPYYESGVRATWQAAPRLAATAVLVNGWQNISENNQDKALGLRLDYTLTPESTLSYYDFFGNEVSSGRLRTLNGVGLRLQPTPRLLLVGNADVGSQRGAPGTGTAVWYGTALIGRLQLTRPVALAARVERYSDPDQAIVATGAPYGLQANGASIGVDVVPAPRTLWRTELRLLVAGHPLFPARRALARDDGVAVTSLALTF